jgi:hypothetical protein
MGRLGAKKLTCIGAKCSPRQYLDDDVPFGIGWVLIVNIFINLWGYADVYFDNTITLTFLEHKMPSSWKQQSLVQLRSQLVPMIQMSQSPAKRW